MEQAEANAQFKGLNTGKLIISQIIANKASRPWRYGRKRRRRMKRTTVEVIVREKSPQKREKETIKSSKKGEEPNKK